MNIAIIEDRQSDQEWLSEKINHYMNQRGLSYTLYIYKRAEDFVEALSALSFDIVFMDIYMDNMTGMEAAVFLRKKDKDCKLIFLTISEEYIYQGYSVNACHYLIKPVSSEDFLQAMENCRIQPQYAVPYLDVIFDGSLIHLNTCYIMYIHIQKRTVFIHTTHQVIKVNGTFSKVTEPLLADNRFLLCIQGVLINMDYISYHEDSVFILKNNERIPIKLRNKKQILQIYRNYIFEHMGENYENFKKK